MWSGVRGRYTRDLQSDCICCPVSPCPWHQGSSCLNYIWIYTTISRWIEEIETIADDISDCLRPMREELVLSITQNGSVNEKISSSASSIFGTRLRIWKLGYISPLYESWDPVLFCELSYSRTITTIWVSPTSLTIWVLSLVIVIRLYCSVHIKHTLELSRKCSSIEVVAERWKECCSQDPNDSYDDHEFCESESFSGKREHMGKLTKYTESI